MNKATEAAEIFVEALKESPNAIINLLCCQWDISAILDAWGETEQELC